MIKPFSCALHGFLFCFCVFIGGGCLFDAGRLLVIKQNNKPPTLRSLLIPPCVKSPFWKFLKLRGGAPLRMYHSISSNFSSPASCLHIPYFFFSRHRNYRKGNYDDYPRDREYYSRDSHRHRDYYGGGGYRSRSNSPRGKFW